MRFSPCWHAATISLLQTCSAGEGRHVHHARDAPPLATPTGASPPLPLMAYAFSPSPRRALHPATTSTSCRRSSASKPRLGRRHRSATQRTTRMSEAARPGADSGLALWLDMRTAVLPAAQTLKTLYGELRQREEALGRSPEDPDWTLSRVPNPVGALLYAAEPEERAAEEMAALGEAAAALPCFRLGGTDGTAVVVDVSSGHIVGVRVDPVGDNAAGGAAGSSAAMGIVAAAQQQRDGGGLVFLPGVRPSVWESGDMGTVLRIASSACAGAGKTLVVTVRSVGQLHEAAMAAFAASQTTVLGAGGTGAAEGGTTPPPMALLIEPMPELWEAGLLYL
ncbi:unnamed protein product [Ectocarpus sp. 8 AP-2014]